MKAKPPPNSLPPLLLTHTASEDSEPRVAKCGQAEKWNVKVTQKAQKCPRSLQFNHKILSASGHSYSWGSFNASQTLTVHNSYLSIQNLDCWPLNIFFNSSFRACRATRWGGQRKRGGGEGGRVLRGGGVQKNVLPDCGWVAECQNIALHVT